jgi:hypothetical protein
MAAAKLEKRQRPCATVGCSVLLLFIVGACARAGDGDAIAPFEAGASPGLDAGSGDSKGSRGSPSGGESAEPGSGVEAGSTSATDGGLAGDVAPGEPNGASTPDANQESTGGAADGGAPNAVDVVADTDADATIEEPDVGVDAGVVVGDELSAPCAQTCTNGCCEPSGTCLEGVTDEACGGGGAACQDCSPAGQTCQSNACRAPASQSPPPPAQSPPPPAPDAGGATCDVSSCSNLCVPYFVRCCRSDATCGCALLFPRGPCN